MTGRPRRRRTLAVVLVAAAALAGCGVPVDSQPRIEDDDAVPGGLLDRATPGSTTPGTIPSGTEITVCLADRAGRLQEVTRSVAGDPTAASVVEVLAAPVSDAERAFGLSSNVASGRELVVSSVDGGVATVELTDDFTQRSSSEQLGAVAQVVCTLTAQPGIGQVHFELSRASVEVPRGDGSTTSDPVSRADYPEQMPLG